MKMTRISLFLIFLLSGLTGFSQTNELEKKLEKAYELAKKDKLDEAEEYLEKLLSKEPSFGDGWDLLAKIRYKRYQSSKSMDGLFSGMTITTKDKDGNEVKNDSLAKKMAELLASSKPSKTAYSKFIYTARRATLESDDAYHCSFYIRSFLIDYDVDTNVNKKALKYYSNAEEAFGKKNYNEAAKHYQRALEEQPSFYKASLYLGDSYYFLGNYVTAINSFKDCVQKFPRFLEPRKYLVDAYYKEKLYANAFDEAVKSMYVYPDLSMRVKMEDAAFMNGKKVEIFGTARKVFPNQVKINSDLNLYTDKNFPKKSESWSHYTAAFDNVRKYCDDKGRLKSNPVTQAKYLEVYCWEEMLKKTADDRSLDEARKMQSLGYLDCYVLVSCFHYDIYDQYLDFAEQNKERIVDYFNTFTRSR